MIKAILIAVTLACFAGGAAAQSSEMRLNGAQLLSACTKADPEWIGFCNGYMQGAFDATGGKGLEGRHDEATVSGIRIMVLTRGTSRRPRNVLERIEMAGDAGAAPAEKVTHEEKVRRIQHVLLSADPDDPQYLALSGIVKSDGRDERRWKEWQEAQQGIRPGSSLESLPPGSFKYTVNLVEVDGVHVPKPGPIGPDGYYTEQANAEIADRKTRQTQPTIISGPRSWR